MRWVNIEDHVKGSGPLMVIHVGVMGLIVLQRSAAVAISLIKVTCTGKAPNLPLTKHPIQTGSCPPINMSRSSYLSPSLYSESVKTDPSRESPKTLSVETLQLAVATNVWQPDEEYRGQHLSSLRHWHVVKLEIKICSKTEIVYSYDVAGFCCPLCINKPFSVCLAQTFVNPYRVLMLQGTVQHRFPI